MVPSWRSAAVLLLAGASACSRSGLEQPDVEATAPPPAHDVDATAPPPTPAPNLPSCSPVDETLVGEAPAPAACGDPPPAWTAVEQLADEAFSVALASDQCGRAVDGWMDSAGVYLAWSVDGGQSFDEPLAMGPGRHPVLHLDGTGAAHAFFVRDATLVHVTLDGPHAAPVEQVLSQTGTPAITGAEPVRHGAAASRSARELAVTWKTSTDPKGIWFASNRATGALVPVRIHDTPGPWTTPRLCLAGRDRVVIVWRTFGKEQQVLSAISEDGGASFCIAPLAQEDSEAKTVGENVDIACTPDGRALAVWDGMDGLRIAALSRAGVWSRGDAISGDPYYPHIFIAGDRALATWIGSGQGFGYTLLDLEGTLAGPNVWAPDLNLDGKPDRLMRTCARDDGFVLLTQGTSYSYNLGTTGPAVFTFIDLGGAPAPSQTFAPYGENAVDVALGCQPTGAVAIWRDASAVMRARWVQ